MISQRAIDLIIECEVSSRAYYEKKYQRPEWPGGASGVTIAIGYDLGYASLTKLRNDWDGRVDDAMLSVMERCIGVTHEAAKQLLPSVKGSILIPWDKAIDVFMQRDIPEWTATVCKAIPGANKLTPDCLGALVSLAYNRGAGGFNSTTDRNREMRAIKTHITNGQLSKVPAEIRAMKRLWPDMKGLRDRRDAEATLFQQGLLSSSAPATRAPESPPRTLPAVPAGKEEAAATGTAVAATGAAAKDAVDAGWSTPELIALIVGGLLLAGIICYVVRRYRSAEPTMARAKDDQTVEATP